MVNVGAACMSPRTRPLPRSRALTARPSSNCMPYCMQCPLGTFVSISTWRCRRVAVPYSPHVSTVIITARRTYYMYCKALRTTLYVLLSVLTCSHGLRNKYPWQLYRYHQPERQLRFLQPDTHGVCCTCQCRI